MRTNSILLQKLYISKHVTDYAAHLDLHHLQDIQKARLANFYILFGFWLLAVGYWLLINEI